ncbi:MAG TPA: hypothetical protein VFG22_09285 [Polyangiales bacterium]|nr:hypothetical protein [Polyangiales bacterium]
MERSGFLERSGSWLDVRVRVLFRAPTGSPAGLIGADSRNAGRIFPYIGGEEVNGNPTQAHRRYVINFGQISLEAAEQRPDLMRIVRERVKLDVRDRSAATKRPCRRSSAVISGRAVFELNDGASMELGPGDTIVRNETRHAWCNLHSERCRMAVFGGRQAKMTRNRT